MTQANVDNLKADENILNQISERNRLHADTHLLNTHHDS